MRVDVAYVKQDACNKARETLLAAICLAEPSYGGPRLRSRWLAEVTSNDASTEALALLGLVGTAEVSLVSSRETRSARKHYFTATAVCKSLNCIESHTILHHVSLGKHYSHPSSRRKQS